MPAHVQSPYRSQPIRTFTVTGEVVPARQDGKTMRDHVAFLLRCMLFGGLLVAGMSCSRPPPAETPPAEASHVPRATPLEPWRDHEQKLASIKAKPLGEITDAEKLNLISWLDHDINEASQHAEKTGEESGEGYGEYLIDLSLTVAGLKDKRALPALVKVMDISQGICTAIAEFGDDAVDPVTAQLN